MKIQSINLAIRFGLELAALIAVGTWGWRQGDGWARYVLALGIPLAMAIIWGVFNVPDDPSRSGNAPVIVPGIVRLILELAFFFTAIWALYNMGYHRISMAFAIITLLHYLVSFNRIIWLISR